MLAAWLAMIHVQGKTSRGEGKRGRLASGKPARATPLTRSGYRRERNQRRGSRFATLPIDPIYPSNYSVGMDSLEQTDKDLQRLEKQLRTLLAQIQKLREENQSLHARQEALWKTRFVGPALA